MVKYAIFIFIVLLISACNSDQAFDCVKTTGKIVEKEYKTSYFKNIDLYDYFTVYLIPDTVDKVVIRSGENLQAKISVQVVDSVLSIKNNNTCNFVRGYDHVNTAYVHFTKLEWIYVLGEINLIATDTIFANYIHVIVKSKVAKANLIFNAYVVNFQVWYGTGDFYLRGKTTHFFNYNDGTGFIYADSLVSRFCTSENRATGDMFLNVNDSLFVTLKGAGDIYYTGNPGIQINAKEGKGQLIKKQ